MTRLLSHGRSYQLGLFPTRLRSGNYQGWHNDTNDKSDLPPLSVKPAGQSLRLFGEVGMPRFKRQLEHPLSEQKEGWWRSYGKEQREGEHVRSYGPAVTSYTA